MKFDVIASDIKNRTYYDVSAICGDIILYEK